VAPPTETATTDIDTLSLHDALPISTFKMRTTNYGEVVTFFNQKTGMNLSPVFEQYVKHPSLPVFEYRLTGKKGVYFLKYRWQVRSEEHTSELQSRENLVCRLLLEKK